MCFDKYSKLFKHSVADHDIECYKIMYCNKSDVDTTIRPLIFHRELKYEVGDTMYPFIDIDISELDELGVVDGGVIHSYGLERAEVEYYHACKTMILSPAFLRPLVECKYIKLVKCVIPKGTAYWCNFKCEYISKELVIKEIISQTYYGSEDNYD